MKLRVFSGDKQGNQLATEEQEASVLVRAVNDAHNNCHYSLAVGLNNKFLICDDVISVSILPKSKVVKSLVFSMN